MWFSSYGIRLNVQGNGECAVTAGGGNLYTAAGTLGGNIGPLPNLAKAGRESAKSNTVTVTVPR